MNGCEIWRPASSWRIFLVLVAIGEFALGVFTLVLGIRQGDVLAGMLVALLLGAPGLWFIAYSRAYVMLCDEGVRARNILSTTDTPWDQIDTAGAGYWGIAILRVDGPALVAMAVQKSNFSTWIGRETRADRLAAAITARGTGHHGTPPAV
jgi:hypothetical protein